MVSVFPFLGLVSPGSSFVLLRRRRNNHPVPGSRVPARFVPKQTTIRKHKNADTREGVKDFTFGAAHTTVTLRKRGVVQGSDDNKVIEQL
jgi:hypothetical protein